MVNRKRDISLSMFMSQEYIDKLDDLVIQLGMKSRAEAVEYLLNENEIEGDLTLKALDLTQEKDKKLKEIELIDRKLVLVKSEQDRQRTRKKYKEPTIEQLHQDAFKTMDEFRGTNEQIIAQIDKLCAFHRDLDKTRLLEHVYGKK